MSLVVSQVVAPFLGDGGYDGKVAVASAAGLALTAKVVISATGQPNRVGIIASIDANIVKIISLATTAAPLDLLNYKQIDNAKITMIAQTVTGVDALPEDADGQLEDLNVTGTTTVNSLDVAGRLTASKGTSTAAAATLTLPSDGNEFIISGNTNVDYITKTNWPAGSFFILQFTGTPTLNHNTGSVPGTAAALKLHGGASMAMAAGDSVLCFYDGTVIQVSPLAIVAGYGTGSLANLAVTAGKLAAQAVTYAKAKVFTSTEQTATGAPQNIAHGLGAVPSATLIVPTLHPGVPDTGAFTITEGAPDDTNVVVTMTADCKFKVLAWA